MGKQAHTTPPAPSGFFGQGSTAVSVDAITRPARRAGAWAIGVVLVGVGLGLFAHSVARAQEDERVERESQDTLTERGAGLEKDMFALGEVLYSLQALHDSSTEVTRVEFATFVRGPLSRSPAVRAVAWAPLVPTEDLDAFIDSVRTGDQPGYAIHSDADAGPEPRPFVAPVLYMHPVGRDELDLGYDLASNPALQDTLSRASVGQEPVVSDRIQPRIGGEAVNLIVHCVFGTVDGVPTAILKGFVVLAFRPSDLCRNVFSAGHLHAQLVDHGNQPLFTTPGFDPALIGRPRSVHIAAREWRLDAHPTEAFIAARRSYTPLLLGVLAAVFFSGLFGLGVFVAARVRAHDAQRQDETLRSVLENLGEGVVVFDRDGVILFTNPASRLLFGGVDDLQRSGLWTSADGCFLEDRATPYPAPHLPLVRTLRGEVVPEEEIYVRPRISSEPRWVGVSGAPLRGLDGEIQGGVLVFRDVTAQRQSKQQRVEMELASSVQERLYPKGEPGLETLDLAGAVFSADATCGDYYDFIRLSEDRVAIAIGDVSGHGLGPALVMTQVRAYLRAFAEMTDDPAEVFERVNRALVADLREADFVTLLVAFLDLRTHRIEYVNAGHVPGYVLDANGGERAKMAKTGMAMGVDADVTYTVGDGIVLEEGDVAVFLTDGVIESRTRDGAMLWDEGALNIVRKHIDGSSAEIIEQLYARVRARASARRRSQEDDVTMVICKALASPVACPSTSTGRADPLDDPSTARVS